MAIRETYTIDCVAWRERHAAMRCPDDRFAAMKRQCGFEFCLPDQEWMIRMSTSRFFEANRISASPATSSREKVVVDRIVAGDLPMSIRTKLVELYDVFNSEIMALTKPGKVFQHGQFHRTTVDPTIWLYGLKAHMRPVPAIHFNGMSLAQQEQILQRAIDAAPELIGGVLKKRG